MVSKRRKATATAAPKEPEVDQENVINDVDGAESVPLMTPVTHIFRPEGMNFLFLNNPLDDTNPPETILGSMIKTFRILN